MWRRVFDFSFFWVPAIVHLGLLAAATVVTIEALPAEAGTPGQARVVLRPLGDLDGYTRTVVSRAGELRFRRTCEARRCELFAGSDHGYTLLASYPAGSTVDLRTWPEVEITRIYRPRPQPSSLSWWLAALFSGVLALCLLGVRIPGDHRELERIERGQDALMTEDGELVLADGRSVCVNVPLPPGAALAICREARLAGAPYRDSPIEIWKAVAGSRTDHLLRIGGALGATKVAMIAIVCANIAALGTVLARLT